MPVSTIPNASRVGDSHAPDRGCQYWDRCTSCPFRTCIAELPAQAQTEFRTAWRVVLRHLARPDKTIKA